jgi:hypothetical protein
MATSTAAPERPKPGSTVGRCGRAVLVVSGQVSVVGAVWEVRDWRRAGLEEEQSGPGHARDMPEHGLLAVPQPMSEADFSRVLGARGGGPGRGGTVRPMASRWIGAAGAVGLSG